MSEKCRIPEDDNSDLDIRIVEAFIRLNDDDKQKVIDRVKIMLSKENKTEKL